jgi:hypothetical protein
LYEKKYKISKKILKEKFLGLGGPERRSHGPEAGIDPGDGST